jgi:phosphoserine aminotransferase
MLTLRWVKEQGGLEAMEQRNAVKAQLLYDEIDRNPKFQATVEHVASRSLMNVCFLPTNPDDLKPFVAAAAAVGCVGIEGHRSVGGFRASIYNSMPLESVQVLVDVMKAF